MNILHRGEYPSLIHIYNKRFKLDIRCYLYFQSVMLNSYSYNMIIEMATCKVYKLSSCFRGFAALYASAQLLKLPS